MIPACVAPNVNFHIHPNVWAGAVLSNTSFYIDNIVITRPEPLPVGQEHLMWRLSEYAPYRTWQ